MSKCWVLRGGLTALYSQQYWCRSTENMVNCETEEQVSFWVYRTHERVEGILINEDLSIAEHGVSYIEEGWGQKEKTNHKWWSKWLQNWVQEPTWVPQRVQSKVMKCTRMECKDVLYTWYECWLTREKFDFNWQMEGKVLFGDIIKGLVLAHANFTEQRHSFSKTEIVFSIRKQENVLNYAVFFLLS